MTQIKIRSTIKTAWNIYCDRFKEFYLLAFVNSFGIFVPVYGWAKYAAMMGLLARLAYNQATGNPETLVQARRHIKPKTWFFFGAGLISSLVFCLKLLLVLISAWIVMSIAFKKYFYLFFNTPLWLVTSALSSYYFYWLISHLFLYELPLAISENTNVKRSRDIGWELATDKVLPMQAIILLFSVVFIFANFALGRISNAVESGVSFETTANFFSFTYSNFLSFSEKTLFFCGALFIPILPSAIYILIGVVVNPFFDYLNSNIVLLSFSIIFNAGIGALFIPFWQSLKAVTYYQLNLPPENTEL